MSEIKAAQKQKQVVIDEIKEKLSNAKSAIIIDYIGINVEEANELRAKLREEEVDYTVYKNTLTKRAIEGTEFENASLEDIVRKSEGGIYNNAGQVMNHNYYFLQLAPNKGGEPTGKIAEAINAKWGSFEAFKTELSQAAATLFGSGWAWLAADEAGNLCIEKEPNAGNPLRKGLKPILCVDVWEHAYYLSYQNRRPDHVGDLFKLINWDVIEERYTA